jgi:rhamnopyranosyl-N-acetylglucosaminyl-diphospho-decaprenol beta-1,3/1,4-galactofuranosyltransferase
MGGNREDGASPSPRVAAVVVTYNRPVELRLVVEALLTQSHPPDAVIVFDNGGPVAAAETLEDWAGAVDIIRGGENLGGAGGFAAGLRHALDAGADWVWLMDDDAVPRADALAALLAGWSDLPERAGALCSTVHEFGVPATRHRRRFGRWIGRERPAGPVPYGEGRVEIDTGSFVGFLVSARAVREVGLPEAGFFLAYDDTEYSLRLKRAGWRLWWVPDSIVEHLRSPGARLRTGPFGSKHYFNIRNRLVVQRRYTRFPAVALVGGIGVGVVLWLMARGWAEPGSLKVLVRAMADGLQGRLGPFPADLQSTGERRQ